MFASGRSSLIPRTGEDVHLPSGYVLKRTAIVTVIAAAISISISTGIRFITGSQADTVTIVMRLVLPFLIAVPIGLVWFTKLERLDKAYRSLFKQANELAEKASTDPLTGLLNRRSFSQQFDMARAHEIKGAFLIADIDYLKSINDRYGHAVGDDAIIATASAMKAVLGDDSLIARIGGDEFCAFLSQRDEADIDAMLFRMERLAAEMFQEATGLADVPLSISVGHAPCKRGETFKDVMAQTDSSLYRKKRSRHAQEISPSAADVH